MRLGVWKEKQAAEIATLRIAFPFANRASSCFGNAPPRGTEHLPLGRAGIHSELWLIANTLPDLSAQCHAGSDVAAGREWCCQRSPTAEPCSAQRDLGAQGGRWLLLFQTWGWGVWSCPQPSKEPLGWHLKEEGSTSPPVTPREWLPPTAFPSPNTNQNRWTAWQQPDTTSSGQRQS